MDVYKENTLTLHFRCDDSINEPEVIKSVFEKIEKIAAKPGENCCKTWLSQRFHN